MGVGAVRTARRYDTKQPLETTAMTSEPFDTSAARSCDPYALARRGSERSGTVSALEFERLADALVDEGGTVDWTARFSTTQTPGDLARTWLDIEAAASLSLPCSRCAESVTLPVAVQRRLRLVPDEALAAQLDEAADDHDVIAADSRFDLLETIEDELILALPAFPEHDRCPVTPGLSSAIASGSGGHVFGPTAPSGDGPQADDADGVATANAGTAPDETDRQFPFADLAAKLGKK